MSAGFFDVPGSNAESKPQTRSDDGLEAAFQVKGQCPRGDNIEDAMGLFQKENPFETGGQDRFGFAGSRGGLQDEIPALKDRIDSLALHGEERGKGAVKCPIRVGQFKERGIHGQGRFRSCS